MWAERELIVGGPIKSADGYGHMTENMIRAWDLAGYNVWCGTHWDHTDMTHVDPRVQQLAHRGIKEGVRVGIRCSQPDSFQIVQSRFKIGLSMFEFTKLPPSWIPGSNAVPLVMVPSAWCQQVWREAGVRSPVAVNQLGVDTELFTVAQRPARDVFTFVMSGTMSERKAPWLAWQAFQAAFPGRTDVRLIIKSPSWLPIDYKGDERITCINEAWPKQAMVDLLHSADCFVYPTRSEGFGLSPCEAMSTGLPVICIGATSCSEFMYPEHSYPLEITGWENVPSHWGDIGAFTCPSLDHLVHLMQHVESHRDEAAAKGRLAAQFIRDRLTWRHNVERTIALVNQYL